MIDESFATDSERTDEVKLIKVRDEPNYQFQKDNHASSQQHLLDC